MADEKAPDEDELADRQGTGLYPVGRALRATFDAENHDSLGNDLTGLMLELARIDPDKPGKVRLPPASAPAAEATTPPPPAVSVAAVPTPPPSVAASRPWWRGWRLR